MEARAGRLFMDSLLTAILIRAVSQRCWLEKHAVEMEKRFARQLEISRARP